jgi:hypothetical protein
MTGAGIGTRAAAERARVSRLPSSTHASLLALLLALGPASVPAQVIINGSPIDDATAMHLAAGIGVAAQPGRYWYDGLSGAFGVEGQATRGFLPPGLALGGAPRPDASGGGDGRYGGVFVNGRELHPIDIAGLQRLLGQVIPGRYWVDAHGSFGLEGGAPLGNLRAIAQMRGGSNGPRGSRASGCYGDSACDTTHSWLGDNYFSDGKSGCIVMDGEITC